MRDFASRACWRVTIQHNVGSTDALNARSADWQTLVGPLWAAKIDQRPVEAWRAGQTAATLEAAFRVRWSAATAAIGPQHRLVCDGRIYSITSVTEPLRREEIEIIGTAAVDGA